MKAGDLSKALGHYRTARLKDPDNPALDYNVGNVLHLDNKFAEAITEYSKALQGAEDELAQMTHYNMGNTHYRAQDLEKAIRSYVDALLADPEDQDAKHNLEMALRATQQQQQQQEDKEDKGGEDNEKEEEEKKEPDPNDEQEEQQPEEGEEDGPQEGDLTREQAERILNALNEQEKKDRKDMKEAESRTGVRVDKDW
jgi:tetratricopeptide (TPR) repeat protein